MTGKLFIRNALVCDDIRKEDNGKAILIGVYSADIIVQRFPFQRNLCVWLHGFAIKGVYELQVRVRLLAQEKDQDNSELTNQVELDFSELSSDQTEVSVSIVGLPIAIDGPHELVIEIMQPGSDEWCELSRKKIRLNPAGSSALELPFEQ